MAGLRVGVAALDVGLDEGTEGLAVGVEDLGVGLAVGVEDLATGLAEGVEDLAAGLAEGVEDLVGSVGLLVEVEREVGVEDLVGLDVGLDVEVRVGLDDVEVKVGRPVGVAGLEPGPPDEEGL